MKVRIDLLDVGVSCLGESPVWDHTSDRLWWVDSATGQLCSSNAQGGEHAEWSLGQPVGSIGLSRGGLIAALADGFYRFSPATGATSLIAHPEMAVGTRLNDGKADRDGRFLCASMRISGDESPGALYSLDTDGTIRTLETSIGIGNAICFSPDGDRLYFADSLDGMLRQYDYDRESGQVSNRRFIVDCREHGGSGADGATVDTEGRIWVALVLAQAIGCYSSEGKLLRSIPVPLPYPSCPAFGGPDLETLYITSIVNSGNRLISDHPDAGRIMAIQGLGSCGIAEGIYC